jgi:ribosomal-protein-alanine N-acetyltransferase
MQLHRREPDPLFDRFPNIETERFHLRRLTVADAPYLFHILSNPEVAKFSGRQPLQRMNEAVEVLRDIGLDFATRRASRWGVSIGEKGRVIATVGLHAWDRYHRHISIGFDVAQDRWGEGIASEAVGAVIEFAFDQLGLHRVEADVISNNASCLTVLNRLGFEREGRQKERLFLDGAYHDLDLLACRRAGTWPH